MKLACTRIRRSMRLMPLALALTVPLMPTYAAADDVVLRPFVRGSWGEIVAARGGGPQIVHFWGLTCGPCRLEMPEWGQLLEQRPGLRLVTIHAERKPPDVSLVTKMLAESSLEGAESWIFDERFQEPLRREIDPAWHGELPRTLLVDHQGNTHTIVGSADITEVEKWLDAQGIAAIPRKTATPETTR